MCPRSFVGKKILHFRRINIYLMISVVFRCLNNATKRNRKTKNLLEIIKKVTCSPYFENYFWLFFKWFVSKLMAVGFIRILSNAYIKRQIFWALKSSLWWDKTCFLHIFWQLCTTIWEKWARLRGISGYICDIEKHFGRCEYKANVYIWFLYSK